jgi:diacylglycerol kinase (ATP)
MTHVSIILNPAAGRLKPALEKLFRPYDAACQIISTTQPGDAHTFARAAAVSGADVVAVCGGDGTVMEAARGLAGTDVPLAILPGGTANLLARDLGIPHRWQDAAALIFSPRAVKRPIDMIRTDDLLFFHLGIGLEGEMVRRAGTATKRAAGLFTYYLSALAALPLHRPARYHLTLDGVPVEMNGVNCTITTYATIGLLPLVRSIDPGDGWLDVIVIHRADPLRLLLAGGSALLSRDLSQAIWHRQARDITVTADPPQPITGDGEIVTLDDLTLHIAPRAVQVITPDQM